MRVSIEGFNQAVASQFRREIEKGGKMVIQKIDCTDLVLLRWFVDFYPMMKKILVDNREFAWVAYNKLLEDLPIIDITKQAFSDRMQKLVSFGILDYKFLKEGGSFSLFTFGPNYKSLVLADKEKETNLTEDGGRVQNEGGMYSNTDPLENDDRVSIQLHTVGSQLHTKDNNNILFNDSEKIINNQKNVPNLSNDKLGSADGTPLGVKPKKRPTILGKPKDQPEEKPTESENELGKAKKQAKSNLIKQKMIDSIAKKYKDDEYATVIVNWVKSIVGGGKPTSVESIESNLSYLLKIYPNRGVEYERALSIATRNGWRDLEWAVKRIKTEGDGNSVLDPSKAPRTGETAQQIIDRHEKVRNQMAENQEKFGSF